MTTPTSDQLDRLRYLAKSWVAAGAEATERAGDEPDRVEDIEGAVMGEVYTECGKALLAVLDS